MKYSVALSGITQGLSLLLNEKTNNVMKQKKAGAEAEERKRIEEQERIEEEKQFADSLSDRIIQQEAQVRDSQGRRWVKCEFCGKIALEAEFSSYGGINHINLGICYECQKNNPKARIFKMPEPVKKLR